MTVVDFDYLTSTTGVALLGGCRDWQNRAKKKIHVLQNGYSITRERDEKIYICFQCLLQLLLLILSNLRLCFFFIFCKNRLFEGSGLHCFGVCSYSATTLVFFVSLMGHFWGSGSKNVLRSTHVVDQLSFSMFLSILTCGFDLILGYFFYFVGP